MLGGSIFDNDYIIRPTPRYTEGIRDTVVPEIDKDEANICLNCTKEKCNGNCKLIKEYRRNKKNVL